MNSKAHTLLLEAPSLIGFIGSADTDGMPRTVPVWYRWDGKVIHITTASSSVWVNNLINDSRSSFCVAEHGPPYQAVVMQGRVQVDNKDEAEVRRRLLDDFNLEMDFRWDETCNSGIQFRSRIYPEEQLVGGYQCELDPSDRSRAPTDPCSGVRLRACTAKTTRAATEARSAPA